MIVSHTSSAETRFATAVSLASRRTSVSLLSRHAARSAFQSSSSACAHIEPQVTLHFLAKSRRLISPVTYSVRIACQSRVVRCDLRSLFGCSTSCSLTRSPHTGQGSRCAAKIYAWDNLHYPKRFHAHKSHDINRIRWIRLSRRRHADQRASYKSMHSLCYYAGRLIRCLPPGCLRVRCKLSRRLSARFLFL